MFNVGDHIVYPMHGAGIIDSIEEKDILGEKQAYYILKMPGEVKVMVPTNKAEEIGVREIIDKQSADKVSNAKQILVSELVLAENSSIEEVEGMIDNKINASFQEFEIDHIEPVQSIVNKFIPFEENANGTENT